MTLSTLLERVRTDETRVRVFAREDGTDAAAALASHGIPVERRPLPADGPDPFVGIYRGDEFAGALPLAAVETLLAPPLAPPGERETVAPGYRALFDALEEAVFTALDREQLLGATREIEDRAVRVGTGTLRVTFQSRETFAPQRELYESVAAETDLDVRLHHPAGWETSVPGVTTHPTAGVERMWVLAFDGGDRPDQACALVAEVDGDGYTGFWTYDPALVAEVAATLEAATG